MMHQVGLHMIASHNSNCSLSRDAESCGLTQKAHERFAELMGVANQCIVRVRVRLAQLPRCSVKNSKFYSKAFFDLSENFNP